MVGGFSSGSRSSATTTGTMSLKVPVETSSSKFISSSTAQSCHSTKTDSAVTLVTVPRCSGQSAVRPLPEGLTISLIRNI